MPEGTIKASYGRSSRRRGKRSKEFLEEALERARKILNARDFAVIVQAARSSAGGQIAARNRRDRETSLEKILLSKASLSSMTAGELKQAAARVSIVFRSRKRSGADLDGVRRRAKAIAAEMKRRGMKPKGEVFKSQPAPAIKVPADQLTPEDAERIRKGFINGEPEGGAHAHSLDRANRKTLNDGGHLHLFMMPGTGELVVTAEDGHHEHALTEDGSSTENDGRHSHNVMLPNGEVVTTLLGGEHDHSLMLETSNFAGNHVHALRLPDGTELTSMTVTEFIERFGTPPVAGPLTSASEITRAMNEARFLQERIDMMTIPSFDDAVTLVAQGQDVATEPTLLMEIVSANHGDTSGKKFAECRFAESDNEVAIAQTFEVEPGDVVEVRGGEMLRVSQSVVPMTETEAVDLLKSYGDLREATARVDFTGPKDAPLVFVSGAPDPLEIARGEGLVGEYGAAFEKHYLAPLRLRKTDVAVGFAIPVQKAVGGIDYEELFAPWLKKQLDAYPDAVVIALGKTAREILGDRAKAALPHPRAVYRNGDSGEIVRKMRALADDLDKAGVLSVRFIRPAGSPRTNGAGKLAADTSGTRTDQGPYEVGISKSAVEKQIVYGVVLDPYQVDAHEDWIPPAEIESTAHGFLAKSRVIGLEHTEKAEATLVESWVVAYPSARDYQLAMKNAPHKVLRQKFGNDTIHSGAWVIGVKLGDKEWAEHKAGRLNAFSIGGFSFKTKVSVGEMPKVEFVDLAAS